MADAAAVRAAELVKKADKRLTSFSLFGGNKYEDAAESLEKAANQYKLAKCCESRGGEGRGRGWRAPSRRAPQVLTIGHR